MSQLLQYTAAYSPASRSRHQSRQHTRQCSAASQPAGPFLPGSASFHQNCHFPSAASSSNGSNSPSGRPGSPEAAIEEYKAMLQRHQQHYSGGLPAHSRPSRSGSLSSAALVAAAVAAASAADCSHITTYEPGFDNSSFTATASRAAAASGVGPSSIPDPFTTASVRETMAHMQDFSLLAEAARRAQVALMVDELQNVSL